jgi:hypothetical protein
MAPMILHCLRNPRITVTGQINQPLLIAQAKEVNKLGSTWTFTGMCKTSHIYDCVDCTGLACIGATGECDFSTFIGEKLLWLVSARKKTGLGVM